MKVRVNGQDAELSAPADVAVTKLEDRLLVRTERGTHSALVARDGRTVYVSYQGHTYKVEPQVRHRGEEGGDASGILKAPLPGQVVDVSVTVGQTVEKGDRMAVMEAMKMQQPVVAPFDGVVKDVRVAVGDKVAEGDVLLIVEAPAHE